MAHPTCWVAVSMPRISTAGASLARGPTLDRLLDGAQPVRPPGAHAPDDHDPLVVAGACLQTHLEEVTGEGGTHDVTPLDERDPVLVEDVRDAQVEQLLHPIEAGG